MTQQLGILDLGSNTARLIVMAFQPHYSFRLVDEVKERVRLVQEAGESNLLQPAPVERAVKTVKMFMAFARAIGVEQVLGIATSAVREASNQIEVLQRIEAETGLRLRVASGRDEAYYAYLGAINSLLLQDGFIVDLGGGSVEMAQVRGSGLVQGTTLSIGTVRMTERFVRSDPVTPKEWRALEEHLKATLGRLDWFKLRGEMDLACIGGIDQQLQSYPLERLHGYHLRRDRLEVIVEALRERSLKERLDLSGLSDSRADVIVAGAATVLAIMRYSGAETCVISGEGLREGLFYENFMPALDPPIIPDVRAFAVENLLRNYGYQQLHVAKVRELALSLFDQLQPLHGYGPWERDLLAASAMLHEIGGTVGYYQYHRYSAHIILNSSLPGYSHREIALIALVAQFHRKGMVTTNNLRAVLDKGDDERVTRLAALLRIAAYLERSRSQVVSGVRCAIGADEVRVKAETVDDGTVEIWETNRRGALFRRAFGLDMVVENA